MCASLGSGSTSTGSRRYAKAFTGQVVSMELETEAQIVFEERRGFLRIHYGEG
jgi:hypothetical protein